MKIKLIKNPKSNEFMDSMNLYMEVFPHDWDYILVVRRLIKNKINKNRKVYLLGAIEKGRVIGASIYSYWKDTKTGLLEYIFVSQKLRSKGVGSELYNKMVADLKKKNCKHLIFNVARDEGFKKFISRKDLEIRKRRLKFYEKMGARPIDKFNYENPLHLSQIQEDYYPSYLAMDKNFSDKIEGLLFYKLVKRFYKRFYYGATERNNQIASRVLKSINKRITYYLRKPKYLKNDN